jgi:hypothetical protein
MAELASKGALNPLMYMSALLRFFDLSSELSYSMIGIVFFGILSLPQILLHHQFLRKAVLYME